ncbi:PAS domain-containing protein [Novosphingobium sp. FSY-8]|uniref:histidine kinase n=1 Tax=Novosphingobium ovatum TaxID=1908523 RepID=A0ABW9XA28_9SPHN|nr:PAS domain-containing sensor histidine kinase [Novosphingobium ovatum]NBC35376.1 PAS domain-containing protein [Novosphingobium ovatum]
MTLSTIAMVLLGLLLAAWMVAAGAAIVVAHARQKRAEAALRNARRLSRMAEESPAQLLMVRTDGRIEGSPRLAQWLGFETLPQFLTELAADPARGGVAKGGRGLPPEQVEALAEAVLTTQRTSRPFRLSLNPNGSRRTLALRGCLADPLIGPRGAAQVWVFDASDAETQLARMRAETDRARSDFTALVGLIEAAPIPMWFREADGRLRLVNTAYVRAVGGENARAVVEDGVELIEVVDGLTPAQVAQQAAGAGRPIERIISTTIDGQRRALRVLDLPLGDEGVAGYAIDIEEMEELGRSFRAFREAQRSMLDLLSSGVAQFDASRRLIFANQPFQRLLAMKPADVINPPQFERLIDTAREGGRVPEMRDYPAWRRERAGWFAASSVQEEAWPLSDGTHLRVVAQPMPDGGLLLVVEDRTETLRISAMRDTLLRTRTATFDSLFEAIAVFAPDGRVQLWNRRFAAAWGLDADFIDTHPKVADLLQRIAARLARPAQAKAVGDVVRAATLERRETGGRVALADGRTLEFAGVPLPDGNGLLTVLDITDSQKAEDALRERNAALVEADQLKTRFLANMSYEFRTPLTSIGGFAELLQAGLGGDLTEPGREYVDAILTSVARLSDQIENVLDLSQSEAGMLPLSHEAIEVFPFVTKLVEERRARILDAGIQFDLRGDPGAGRIEGDPRRLGRAVGHLIDNAIAAVPRGGRVLVELSRHRLRGANRVRIVVSDNGPGMDAATLARALGGLKLGADGLTAERRQGLGLPLARQLIEAHGGQLDVESLPGHGTTAIVELP